MNLLPYITYLISTLANMLTCAPLIDLFGIILASAVIRIVINFVFLNVKKSEV